MGDDNASIFDFWRDFFLSITLRLCWIIYVTWRVKKLICLVVTVCVWKRFFFFFFRIWRIHSNATTLGPSDWLVHTAFTSCAWWCYLPNGTFNRMYQKFEWNNIRHTWKQHNSKLGLCSLCCTDLTINSKKDNIIWSYFKRAPHLIMGNLS